MPGPSDDEGSASEGEASPEGVVVSMREQDNPSLVPRHGKNPRSGSQSQLAPSEGRDSSQGKYAKDGGSPKAPSAPSLFSLGTAASQLLDDFGLPAVNRSFAAGPSLKRGPSLPSLPQLKAYAMAAARHPLLALPLSVHLHTLRAALRNHPPSLRTVLLAGMTFLFLLWLVSDCPPDCSLLPAVRPANACGYSERELASILNMPRGFKSGEPRYFWSGRWVDFLTVQFEMEMWMPHTEDGQASAIPCLLVSVEGQLPCRHTSCVMPIYVRPLTSDLLTLKAHVEDHPPLLGPLYADTDLPQGEGGSPPGKGGGAASASGEGGVTFRSVLDAGASIGISTAMLALMFPGARIVAVEASADNFRMLRLNTLSFPNVIPIHAALWGSTGPPLVVHRDPKASGYWFLMTSEESQVAAAERGKGPGASAFPFGVAIPLDVPSLLSLTGLPSFDLLWIDVEGAEMHVLSPDARPPPLLTPSNSSSSSSEVSGEAGGTGDALWWAREARVAVVSSHENTHPGSEQLVRSAFPLSHFSIEFGPSCSIFRLREPPQQVAVQEW